jgi:hypothetical protein
MRDGLAGNAGDLKIGARSDDGGVRNAGEAFSGFKVNFLRTLDWPQVALNPLRAEVPYLVGNSALAYIIEDIGGIASYS